MHEAEGKEEKPISSKVLSAAFAVLLGVVFYGAGYSYFELERRSLEAPTETVVNAVDTQVDVRSAGLGGRTFEEFVEEYAVEAGNVGRSDRATLDLDGRLGDICNTYKRIKCDWRAHHTFECRLVNGRSAGDDVSLELRWPLKTIRDANDEVLQVAGRRDVVRKELSQGGLAAGTDGVGRVGVAVVCAGSDCDKTNLDTKQRDLRVAFAISHSDRHPSIFRTIGYDWSARVSPPTNPYEQELFALGALHKISRMLFDRSPPNLTDSEGKDVLTRDTLEKWRTKLGDGSRVRVGNNSDSQLGMSRGACMLANSARVGVIHPTAFTPILPNNQPSIALTPESSLPCVLFVNWRIETLGIDRDTLFRDPSFRTLGFSSRFLSHEPNRDGWALRDMLALRAAAFTLHTLGFDISYALDRHRISGQWPRPELFDLCEDEFGN